MLIIGCGNRQRSDDGAGILVAERLRKLGIEADARVGEAADLIEAWKGDDDVIVVDAVVTGAPVGTVQAWDGRQQLASVRTTASTHCLGVAEAIELAHVLNRLPTRLRVYGIEGRRFEPGAEISPEVQRAVEEVVRRIIADLSAPFDSGRPSPQFASPAMDRSSMSCAISNIPGVPLSSQTEGVDRCQPNAHALAK